MLEDAAFTGYNLFVGLVTGLGVVYFLYCKQAAIEYRRFLVVTSAGLVLFLVGGPVVELVAPELVHWVHGTAALLVIVGMYDPVEQELRQDEWSEILLDEPGRVRRPAEWMLPVDDAILDLFHGTDLVLTPAVVAYNIEYSREEVNRRLSELEDRGFVTRVERGKYRITGLGAQYVEGSVSTSLAGSLRHLWRSSVRR